MCVFFSVELAVQQTVFIGDEILETFLIQSNVRSAFYIISFCFCFKFSCFFGCFRLFFGCCTNY